MNLEKKLRSQPRLNQGSWVATLKVGRIMNTPNNFNYYRSVSDCLLVKIFLNQFKNRKLNFYSFFRLILHHCLRF